MTDHKKTDAWIESVYKSPDRESLRATYDKWAATYDADMVATGYVHYPVIIGLVCRHVLRKDAAILDAGVGTGAIGSLLNIMGYNNLSGIDMSEGMLERAAARKVYADLRKAVLGETLDFVDRSFDAIISLGTFTEGHAPASAFDELVRLLDRDGLLLFTISTHVWEDGGFRRKLESLTDKGYIKQVEATHLYQPMPYSEAEAHITTRAFVYRKVS